MSEIQNDNLGSPQSGNPQENNNNGEKTGRFDNSAYEAMMKDRKM